MRTTVGILALCCTATLALAQVDGVNIPDIHGGSPLIVTQTNPTSYGNDTDPSQDPGCGDPCNSGNEMNRMWVDDDGTNLRVSITGNLQYNGNCYILFFDTQSGGQALINSDPGFDEGPPYAMNGLHNSTFDSGFEPDYAMAFDCFAGNIYVTWYTLENGVCACVFEGNKAYQGQGFVASGNGDLDINPDLKVAMDNGNIVGVLGTGDGGGLGDPTDATTGMEALIPLTMIGSPAGGTEIRIWAMLKSGSGDGYISNQALPPYDGLGDEINGVGNPGDPFTRPGYHFDTDPLFDGQQWASYTLSGAACVPCDTNCDGSVNGFDIDPLVTLLTGGGSPCSPCAGDVNGDGSVNGFDVDGFVAALSGGGC